MAAQASVRFQRGAAAPHQQRLAATAPHERRSTCTSPRERRTASRYFGLASLAAAVLAAFACGGKEPTGARPDAVLAETRAAQAAFRSISERWRDAPDSRAALREPLLRFVQRYPQDEQVRLALVYLGWLYVERGELAQARHFAARTRSGAQGVVHDLADVVEAAIRVRQGQPAAALGLLLPLEGKLIDPAERAIYREQLVLALLKAGRSDDAILAMLQWGAETPLGELEPVHAQIEPLLRSVPLLALERTLLDRLATEPDSELSEELRRERVWLRGVLVDILAQRAIDRQDAELARKLLGERPTSERQTEQRVELARLAASGGTAPTVRGRLVGLVLSTGSLLSQRRSAEVARGLTRALDLPKLGRDPSQVQIVSAAETGKPGDMGRSLAELAGIGAGVLVAGVDERGSKAALEFSRATRVPVILIEPPAEEGPATVFVAGERQSVATELLRAELSRRGLKYESVSLELCAASPPRAGAPKFPFGKWKSEGVDALIVLGPAACAAELGKQGRFAGYTPLLALGLASADAFPRGIGQASLLAVAADAFPLRPAAGGAAPLKSLRQYEAQSGVGPSWYAALGHDLGRLARVGLLALPASETQEQAAVAEFHGKVTLALGRANAELWTSEERGFDSQRRIPRKLELLSSPR